MTRRQLRVGMECRSPYVVTLGPKQRQSDRGIAANQHRAEKPTEVAVRGRTPCITFRRRCYKIELYTHMFY